MPLDCTDPEVFARAGLRSLLRFLSARDLTCKIVETALFVPDTPDNSEIEAICYVAVEACKKGTKDSVVTAMIVELRSSGSSSGSITSIVHHEAECPEHVDCPLEVLAVLTPTDCKMALQWRRNCLKGVHFRKPFRITPCPRLVSLRDPADWLWLGVFLRSPML